MKRWVIVLVLIPIMLATAWGKDAKEQTGKKKEINKVYKEIRTLYEEGKYEEVIRKSEQEIAKTGMELKLVRLKYDAQIQLEKYDDALAFIQKAIDALGEKEALLSAKYHLYMLKRDFPNALKTAKHRYDTAKTKSPWTCMDIVHVYLAMGSKEDALNWLQEAANRGFLSYRILAGRRFKLLAKEKRFYEIIESIKVSVGLGYPARNFQGELVTGQSFNLNQEKGKVVLVMFWATWCPDCRRDIKEIKDTYAQFKDKGFEIVGVNLDSKKELLKKFVQQFKLEWKQVYSGKGWQDPVVIRYGINSIPSYWLIDKKGILRSFDLEGPELKKAIATLLAE